MNVNTKCKMLFEKHERLLGKIILFIFTIFGENISSNFLEKYFVQFLQDLEST